MFDFNDSLNNVLSLSLMLFPVDVKRKSELLMDVFHVPSLFHNTDQVL